jgi:hypothetical protein
MIVECPKHRVSYNNETVQYCPLCNHKKAIADEYVYNGEANKTKDIWKYRRETIQDQKKVVGSFRTSDRIAYERTTGKSVFGNNVK